MDGFWDLQAAWLNPAPAALCHYYAIQRGSIADEPEECCDGLEAAEGYM